jgi:Flp pilus assembly protein TadG
MLPRHRSRIRRGAVMVETAVVLPLTVGLFLGTTVAGLGVHRYNQLAYLARQGSRWASVRGPQYQADQNKSAPTASDVMTNAVVPYLSGINQGDLTPTLTWNTNATPATVSFKLDYTWLPEMSLTSIFNTSSASPQPVTFTSTSTQLITY